MADWYVRSGAGGAGTGADWANAKVTLAAAATASAAGDRIFVSEDHAESTVGAVTVTFPGTTTAPSKCYCVNHSGTVPPVAADLRTTATVSVGNSNSTLTINGFVYCYGVIFQGGTANGTSAIILCASNVVNRQTYESCGFTLRTINAGGAIGFGGSTTSSDIILISCIITFGTNAAQVVVFQGRCYWRGGSVAWTTQPTTLMAPRTAGWPCSLAIEGVDFSNVTNTLFAWSNITPGLVTIKDCKLNASTTISATPTSACSGFTDSIRSDSGNTNYKIARYQYAGTLTSEATIVRTGGATDGTTVNGWKIVTSANSTAEFPFDCPPIRIWNDSTSSSPDAVTVTLYGIWAGGTSPDIPPNNDDIWFELSHMGNASFPTASFATCEKTWLATAASHSTDSSTWGGSQTAFKMSVTFTPRQHGPIDLVVRAAKASTTFYIDPKPSISGVVVSKSYILAPSMHVNELSSVGRPIVGLHAIDEGLAR
jgi:hypothetical protein